MFEGDGRNRRLLDGARERSKADARAKLRIALDPRRWGWVTIFLAADKGYFRGRNPNVEIIKYSGSSLSHTPLAVRGAIDILPIVSGPVLFNQLTEGFDLQDHGLDDQPHTGWHDGERCWWSPRMEPGRPGQERGRLARSRRRRRRRELAGSTSCSIRR